MHSIKLIFFIIALGVSTIANSQYSLTGVISDETGTPIPSAKIFVKNSADLRSIADDNGYYEMRLYQGEYFLVITSSGFKTIEGYVTIGEHDVVKNFTLNPINIQDIEKMEVSAKKSNPGRDIMLKVVAKRNQLNPWNYPHSVEGYTKATETITRKVKKGADKKKKKKEAEQAKDPSGVEDPFAEQKKADRQLSNNMNLIEVDFTRHFGGKNKVKEIRNAYEERGSKRHQLYYTTTVKSNFNFFQNLLHLDDLHQTPVSSPISTPGIFSYKYRLEEQYVENGRNISKIKIIPRNISTTTLEGYIYVIDTLWLVQKLELTMEKGNLLIYDYFTISQIYDHPGDSICVLMNQKLSYGVKYSNESSECSTNTSFRNYNFNPEFPERFFNNELSIT